MGKSGGREGSASVTNNSDLHNVRLDDLARMSKRKQNWVSKLQGEYQSEREQLDSQHGTIELRQELQAQKQRGVARTPPEFQSVKAVAEKARKEG